MSNKFKEILIDDGNGNTDYDVNLEIEMPDSEELFENNKDKIEKMKNQYEFNKNAKVGEMITCPSCGKEFKKKSYQQKFDNTKCKDYYHNMTNFEKFDWIVEQDYFERKRLGIY